MKSIKALDGSTAYPMTSSVAPVGIEYIASSIGCSPKWLRKNEAKAMPQPNSKLSTAAPIATSALPRLFLFRKSRIARNARKGGIGTTQVTLNSPSMKKPQS